MKNQDAYKQEIERLQQQLDEKDELLQFTRSYADRLLAQVNDQVENIQVQQQLLQHQHRQLVDSIECARQVLATVTSSLDEIKSVYSDSFIIFQPKNLIGGDFFWVHTVADKVFLAMGDCTGHGVSGGILSLMGDMLLRQAVIEHQMLEPSDILSHINQAVNHMKSAKTQLSLLDNITSDIAIDMLVSVHDTKTNELHISSAHMPFYVWESGGLHRIKGGRAGIGVGKAQHSFETITRKLKPDTAIYYTTDGFADQFRDQEESNGKVSKFGRTRMLELFESNAEQPWPVQHQNILNAFTSWKGADPQTDDVMLIGVKYASLVNSKTTR